MAYEKCSRYLDYFGSNQRDATVIGFNRKASLHNAVLINGYSAPTESWMMGTVFVMCT